MPFLAFDDQTGLLTHCCATCQHVQQALPIDPAQKHLGGSVGVGVEMRGENVVVVCSQCGAEEHHRLDHAVWEEGNPPVSEPTPHGMGTNPLNFGPQPEGSLVGNVVPLDNGLYGRVTAHRVGWHTAGERTHHIRLLRQIARHPAIQAQLPATLKERLLRLG